MAESTTVLSKKHRRNPQRTRARILRSATALFAAKGPDGTTVDEIAAHARINKRMLYHYFGNKQNLYLSVLRDVYHRLSQISTEIVAQAKDLRALLDGLLREYFGFLQQNPEFVALLNWENSHGAEGLKKIAPTIAVAPLINATREALNREMIGQDIRDGVDVKYLTMACLALCSYYFTNRHTLSVVFDIDLDDPANMEKWIGQIRILILDGVVNRAAKE